MRNTQRKNVFFLYNSEDVFGKLCQVKNPPPKEVDSLIISIYSIAALKNNRKADERFLLGVGCDGCGMNIIALRHLTDCLKKAQPILIIIIDLVAFTFLIRDMIKPAFIFYSTWSTHET